MTHEHNEIIAPGAFAKTVGKVVPVTANGQKIGTARILDENGLLEITFHPLESRERPGAKAHTDRSPEPTDK